MARRALIAVEMEQSRVTQGVAFDASKARGGKEWARIQEERRSDIGAVCGNNEIVASLRDKPWGTMPWYTDEDLDFVDSSLDLLLRKFHARNACPNDEHRCTRV